MSDSSIPRPSYDVLIIGGGAAGLYTALSLPSTLQIGLVTKDHLSFSASDWAQGGIAAAYGAQDSPTLHAQDTLKAGGGLCEAAVVEFVAQQAPLQVERLLEMGIAFDRSENQALAFTLEAAHSRPRVLHAADATGRALIQTLMAQVMTRGNIEVLADTFTLQLWLGANRSRCQGACLLSQGQIFWVAAQAVVLATGGGGQVFAQTTNPALSTGDGVAMAWRSGAQVRDLEFVQFHPTALTVPNAPRFLISEAVRGEGAHLVDEQNRRFMFDYDARGELAPRDVVSRSIVRHLQQQRQMEPSIEQVWLDLQAIPVETIQRRFPKIIRVCKQWGIDVLADRIPVAPAAHYWMGGIVTDLNAQTSIPGLYAVGEVASTGVHGANRLASNSLLECLVFGAQLKGIQTQGADGPRASVESTMAAVAIANWDSQYQAIVDIRDALPHLVWDSAGISREGETMAAALAKIQAWQQQLASLPVSQALTHLRPSQGQQLTLAGSPTGTVPDTQIRCWAETRNLLDIAALILQSALFRQESRGGHYRSDFPDKNDDQWQVHTLVTGDRLERAALASTD